MRRRDARREGPEPDALCVCAVAEGGARRAAQPRARDIGASIWTRGDEEEGPGGAGGEGGEVGADGAPLPRRWEPRAVFNTRRDPCLAEAAQFIRSRRPAPRDEGAPTAAGNGAAASNGAAAPGAAAGAPLAPGTASAWGVKRLRTTLVGGDEKSGAGAAATVTQQMDSAPTSDNEHDGAAMLLRPAGEAGKSSLLGALGGGGGGGAGAGGDDGGLVDLVDFPWAAVDVGPGAWDGAGALLA